MSESSQQPKFFELPTIKMQQKSQPVLSPVVPSQPKKQQNIQNQTLITNQQQSSQISMTIKQQQTIQQILHEVLNNSSNKNNRYGARERNSMHNHYTHNYDYTNFQNNYQLDQDIEKLLKESELQIQKEYEAMAREQFLRNRMSISINDEQDKLKEIFQRMDAISQRSKEQKKNIHRKHKNSYHQAHSLSLQVPKRKQSMMSQASNTSRARKQSTASNDKSEGFGTAFNLDTDKLKLSYPFDDDSFIHSSDGEDGKYFKIKSYTNIPSHLNKDKDSNQSSSQDGQSSDQQSDINVKINLTKSQKIKASATVQPQYILDKFQREQINKPKQQTLQIQQLDQKYPKINPMTMYRHQYPIFKIKQSSTSKYVRFLKKSMSQINCLVTFMGQNGVKWTILAIEHQMYVFIGQDWKQPIIINPQRNISNSNNNILNTTNKIITSMQLSPQHNFIAISLGIQIIIYQIKKQTNNLVLVKNLNSTDDLNARLIKINKIIFYDENPIKIAYIDNYQNVGLLTVEQIMLFTRIGERSVQHGIDIIMDMDVLSIPATNAQENAQKVQETQNKKSSGFSFGKFNQKITNLISKNNTGYLAIASRTQLMLFRIQPNVQLLHTQALRQQTTRDISIRWRYNAQNQTKPQLLISQNNKIYIYKLVQNDGSSPDGNRNKQVYLQIHLMYQNHYDITQMEIISNTHLLLHSNQNIIIIAIPLIPSTDLSITESSDNEELQTRERSKSGSYNQMFESALVFITSEKQCRILFTSPDEVIYYSSKEEKLQVANLRTLQEYIDELMIQKGHFRQAFTLLMLVHKGVNYSFKFAYTSQALIQCIFTAVQCTIGSLILSMDDNIVEYRLGWVCQLLIQTHNQNMIWGTVYKKLQQKQKERERQIDGKIQRIQQQKQEQQKKKHRDSMYQVLRLDDEPQYYTPKRKLSKNYSLQSQKSEQRKSKFLSHHHFSTILEETTSSQLKPKAPKNLQHILFDILEVFVLKSFITSMPENIFLQFVQYQCEKMSDTILQKVITQNKSPYDGSKLLSLLQHKQRNYLQLFLFSRALICDDPDFYTPFIKVFASFKSQSEKIQKSNNKQVKQEVIQKMNNTGMMCLWYLRNCLRFERIPSGIMPLNQKMTIIQSLCAQILQPAFTKKLFAFNSKVFLQTYLLMFLDTELSIMIQQQNQMLVEKYKQFYPEIYQSIMSVPPSQTSFANRKSLNQANEQIFDKAFKQLVILHLQKTVPALKNQTLYWSQFLALAFYFNKVEVCLTFEAVVDVLIVLFENKFDSYNLYVPPKVTARPSIEQLELSLIQYIKPVLLQKKDRFYMNKLINFSDKNVSYYLFRIDQNYKQALEHFISSRDSNNLIPFIYQLLGDIKEIGKDNPDNYNDKILRQRKFSDLKQILVRNIGLLFKIDKFQALNIFYQIGQTSQSIYNLIEENMGNKLDFLTAVLKKFQNQDFDIKQRFQLEHLSEVCMLKNKKMLAFLDQFNYPLDQGIIVCEQKGNLLAKAILQQRNGKISDAFMSYERIVKGIIQLNSNNSASSQKQKPEKQIKKDVRKYTDQCIRLCKHYSYDPNAGPENNFWLRIITFINGFIKSNSQHKVFLKVEFQKVLQHILSQMFQFLPTSVLIDFFITKGHRLELSLTKQFSIFQNLFVLARFDINVAKKALQIFKLDIKDTRKQALIKRKNGIICAGVCDFCKKPLGEESNCNIYSCKHAFHKLCHEDIYRCLTCYYQSDNSILSSNIFGTQLAKGGIQDRQQTYLRDKSSKKKLKSITNMNIIVESSQLARQEGVKKKLKVYDFSEEKQNQVFYNIIDSYNEKQKQKQKLEKLQQFQNQYLRYTKAKGLEIKEKTVQPQNLVHNIPSYKQ